MPETIKLDPTAVATSRTEVDISAFISEEGVDWGDAQIEAFMADAERGAIPVDYRIPNRTVTIPLKLTTRGAVTFDTIRRNLQAKAALFQREGGWMSRQTSVGTLYGDIVNATLRLGGDWYQANRSFDTNAVLTLELVPDWYGAEVSLDDQTETTLPAFVKVLRLSAADAVIAGDYPGRVRIVVDEDDADTQRSLLWGFRSRYYSSATTAALQYEAETRTALGGAAVGTITTASGGGSNNAIVHQTMGDDWNAVMSTQASGGGAHLTHTGTYRVWARVYCSNPLRTPMRARFLWDTGDLVNPVINTPVYIPSAGQLYLVDFGEIRIEPSPVGTHLWQGQIQAVGDTSAESAGPVVFAVDVLFFQPIDDGGGRLAVSVEAEPGLVAYTARDEFNQTAGALSGKTLPTGGTWSIAGDTTDASVETTGHTLQRTAVSDTEAWYGLAGASTPSTVAVQADVKWNAAISAAQQGVFARYVSTSSNVFFSVQPSSDGTADSWVVGRGGGAGASTIYASDLNVRPIALNTWYSMRLVVDTSGNFWAWFWATDSEVAGDPILMGQDSRLATGGAEDDGRIGIFDHTTSASAVTRSYNNFLAWVPNLDAVMFASQSAELRTEGIFRENSGGTAYGPISPQAGSLPRIPVSGLESRKVELFLKASRSDLDQIPDAGVDDISARVHYRPSWLIAPGS